MMDLALATSTDFQTWRKHALKFRVGALCSLIFLSVACNPLQGGTGSLSSLDSEFHPGLPSASSTPEEVPARWLFDAGSDAHYNFDPAKISLVGGVCKLSGVDFTDTLHANWNAGTFYGTTDGTLVGASSYTGLKLGNDGSCDGRVQNCNPGVELDPATVPQPAHLVALYHLNETSGAVAADSSGHFKNATTTDVTPGAAGKIKKAASLNGTSSLFSVDDISVGELGSNDLTISTWIYFNTLSSTVMPVMKGSWKVSGYYVQVNPNGAISFVTNQTNTYQSTSTDSEMIAAGVWYHLAFVRSGSTVKIYLNGVDVTHTSAAHVDAYMSPNHLTFGQYDVGNYVLDGKFDEIAVWNTALNDSEIQKIYAPQAANSAGAFISRAMDGATAQTWKDFEWSATLPFFKTLPDYANGAIQNETTTAYPSLASASLMNNIVGLWHLDEASGTSSPNSIIDHSGNDNYLTPDSGIHLGVPGKLGTSAQFNGGNALSRTGTTGLGTLTAFTLSAWANFTGTGTGCIISGGDSGNRNFQMCLEKTASDARIEFYSTGPGEYFSNNFPISKAIGWHHYTLSYASGVIHFYVDGIEAGGVTGAAALVAGGTNLFIGQDFYNNYFTGYIDEVGVWSRAIDPLEIQQLYQRGASRIKFQVRSCLAADCNGGAESWHGPDGTATSYFSELNNVTLVSPHLKLQNYSSPIASKRFFQYKAIFESDDSDPTLMPELTSVAVGNHDLGAPSISSLDGMSYSTLSTFVETLGTHGCSKGITYNLGIGPTAASVVWYRWDASANSGSGDWVIASGAVGESNPVSVISAHAASLASAMGAGKVYFKSFLSSSGTSACELDQLLLNGTP